MVLRKVINNRHGRIKIHPQLTFSILELFNHFLRRILLGDCPLQILDHNFIRYIGGVQQMMSTLDDGLSQQQVHRVMVNVPCGDV